MASRQHESPLRRKLRELSQYAGVRRDNLYEFLGQELRALWHISETDHPETVLGKVTGQLERLIELLRREEHRLTARYSFNITGDAAVERLDLGERQEELAKRRGPSAKSSRNYMSKAILPQFEASLHNHPPPPVPGDMLAAGTDRATLAELAPAQTASKTPPDGGHDQPHRIRRLIAVTATVALLVIIGVSVIVWRTTADSDQTGTGFEPGPSAPTRPESTTEPVAVPGETHTQLCMVRAGCPVFNDPHTPNRAHHQKIAFTQDVEVSCKIYSPSMPSVEWWYRLASEPYNNEWSAPAINFLNGDPLQGPYPTDVDEAVPDC